MGLSALLASIAAGAAVVAATINVLRDPLDRNHTWPNSLIDGIALVIGVAYAVGWRIDLASQVFVLVPALAGGMTRLSGVAGQVLSGLVFGAAATFGAKLFNTLGAIQNNNQQAAKR